MEASIIKRSDERTGSGRLAGSGRPEFGKGSANALSMKWSALHDAAGIVATIAGFAAEAITPQIRNFPANIRDASDWRRELGEQGIEDMSAVMEPGLSALLAAHARGTTPQPAAEALWHEFLKSRDSLLALCPRNNAGVRRSA